MEPLDPGGILREEWANARGAIARFDRSAIEVRLLDAQECPRADLAVAAAAAGAVRALVEERFAPLEALGEWPEEALLAILLDCGREGSRALLRDGAYLRCLGWRGPVPCRAGELWARLADETFPLAPGAAELRPSLETLLRRGTLAERILEALGPDPSRGALRDVYGRLADCIRDDRLFGEAGTSATKQLTREHPPPR